MDMSNHKDRNEIRNADESDGMLCGTGAILKRNGLFYLFGAVMIFGIKLFYSRAGSGGLKWILGPTACWVEILSGIPFEYEPGAGYVNHSLRYLIAPSCAGINFMVIMMASLLFPFLHRMEGRACTVADGMPGNVRKLCWLGGSMLFSYVTTIFVNGLRILAAIYLPDYLRRAGLLGGFWSEERLHTAIGVVVYLVCLLAVYRLADDLACRLGGTAEAAAGSSRKGVFAFAGKLPAPAFWYFGFTLGLPLITGAYRGEMEGYGEYAALVILAGGIVLAVCGFLQPQHKNT